MQFVAIRRLIRAFSVIALLLATAVAPAQARFMMPTDAPVDRIVENMSAYVKENPKDPQGYYTLGRVHYLAWSLRTGQIGVFPARGGKENQKPNVAADWMQTGQLGRLMREQATKEVLQENMWKSVKDVPADKRRDFYQQVNKKVQTMRETGWKPESNLTEAELDDHVISAIVNLHKAIELDKDKAVYHLTLGSVLDEASATAGRVRKQSDGATDADKKVSDEDCAKAWQDAALEQYEIAYEQSVKEDAKLRHRPVAGIQTLVSYNAAKGYTALIEKREDVEGDKALLAKMAKSNEKIEGLQIGAITPIVFALDRPRKLKELLDPQQVVSFDLDGDGVAERRPWLRSDTAILVWDPSGRGAITSGRQLFGNVTWWLFWDNGYRALDALDDNRDGELAAGELRGLAVWRDRNRDGASEPGEVLPIERTGVAAIVCREQSEEDGCPMNPLGLKMHDGRVLPTYDWIAPPAD